MQDLLDRLKAATGPDRELDRAVALAVGELHEDPSRIRHGRPQVFRIEPDAVAGERHVYGGLHDEDITPPVTSSLDAALRLVERTMKPGLLEVTGGWNPADPAEWPAWTVKWYPPHVPKDGKSWWAQVETAPTPALALIATLLSALLYEQQQAPRIAASSDVGSDNPRG